MNGRMFCNTTMFQSFYHTDVSIMQLNIFTYQSNGHILSRMTKCLYHGFPVVQIWFRARKIQTFTGYLSQMFFFHGQWCFIEIFYIQILKNVADWHITEQSNFFLQAIFQWMLRTAYQNIRPDSHTLQLLDTGLGRLGFHFTGSLQVRN